MCKIGVSVGLKKGRERGDRTRIRCRTESVIYDIHGQIKGGGCTAIEKSDLGFAPTPVSLRFGLIKVLLILFDFQSQYGLFELLLFGIRFRWISIMLSIKGSVVSALCRPQMIVTESDRRDDVLLSSSLLTREPE